MTAKRLLELNEEFANADAEYENAVERGVEPGRTKDDIAEEYGQVLRAFLSNTVPAG